MAESLRSASVTKQIPAILPRDGSKKSPLTRRHTASAFHTAWAWPTSSSVWSVSTPGARRGQVVRSKLAKRYGPFSLDHKVYPARVFEKGWLFDRPAPMFTSPLGFFHSPIGCDARPRGARPYLSTDIRPGEVGRVCAEHFRV
jgi:hypothetical protein